MSGVLWGGGVDYRSAMGGRGRLCQECYGGRGRLQECYGGEG